MADSDCHPPYESYATKLAAAITAHIAVFTKLGLPVPDFLTSLQAAPAAAQTGGNTGTGTAAGKGGDAGADAGNGGDTGDAGNGGTGGTP